MRDFGATNGHRHQVFRTDTPSGGREARQGVRLADRETHDKKRRTAALLYRFPRYAAMLSLSIPIMVFRSWGGSSIATFLP